MEHVSIFEKSYQEIQKLKKDLISESTITVDFSKLDNKTAGIIREVLNNELSKRSSRILSVISNVQKEDCRCKGE